ncbi:MAG TPA: hypothetical protein VFV87_07755 [Pirellulaceae bacterium]|nr:hypothetical protein [Pirellulaceae bacterium]
MRSAESGELIAKECDGAALHLEFVWHGDRFGHVISLIETSGRRVPLLESVEGTADESSSSPPSPPLQSLSLDPLPEGRRVALLVGMAGRDHWSASIEPLPDAAGFAFDIACRCSRGDIELASAYRLALDHRDLFAAADRSWIEARLPDGRSLVVTANGSAAPSDLELKNPTTFTIAPRAGQGNATIRWKYCLQLLPSDS